MSFPKRRVLPLVAGAVLATAACGGNSAVPRAQTFVPNAASQPAIDESFAARSSDDTSILKRLKKNVVIGSTVDPTNGDTGPRAVAVVQANYGLKAGQLMVCNFADSTRAVGKGTTIDVFDPKPNSKAATFAQSAKIEGCAGDATTTSNNVYGAGFTSGLEAGFNQKGKLGKTYGPPLQAPFSDADAACPPGSPSCLYSAEFIFTSDAQTGGIVVYSVNYFGIQKPKEVGTGFAVNKKRGWGALGPSGLAYSYPADTLYIADGVDNTVVGFTHASELMVKDEIVVQPGGKTFKCKFHSKTDPCGKLIKAGSPLKAPVAMTLLPNGNLIAANTKGGSTLVEFTPAGKVLATKAIGGSKKGEVFGLAASGTNDDNTVLYYTNKKDNTLHALEQ